MSNWKAVKSTDPRKPKIMELLKKASNANKITAVKECELGFRGTAFKYLGNREYENLGDFFIKRKENAEKTTL